MKFMKVSAVKSGILAELMLKIQVLFCSLDIRLFEDETDMLARKVGLPNTHRSGDLSLRKEYDSFATA